MATTVHQDVLEDDEDGPRVGLTVRYGRKQARITMPRSEGQSDGEPGHQAYLRELRELIAALVEWERSSSEIR